MMFKKHGKTIFGVTYTAEEEKAIQEDVDRRVAEVLKSMEANTDAQFLWYLHQKMHWGKDGLIKVFKEFHEPMQELVNYYQMHETDVPFVAKLKLKEIGVDIDALLKESGEFDG